MGLVRARQPGSPKNSAAEPGSPRPSVTEPPQSAKERHLPLNEQLRASVEAALRRRQDEREADRLGITLEEYQDPAARAAAEKLTEAQARESPWAPDWATDTSDVDAESDHRVEQMLLRDEQERSQAKAALTQLCELWVRAGSSQRALALTALTSASTPVQLSQDEPYSHLCEPELICVTCLTPILAELPDRAQAAIELTAQTPPLDGLTLAEIGSDRLIEGVLTLHQPRNPKVVRLTQPDGSPVPDGSAEIDFGSMPGSMGSKLAALLREDT